ncbi:hypothetical protein ACK8P5_25870 (plasmid) [Paenibacillus sp. EC2-1]|uniref:hypothetical protein n=1 Tax=Paenibacillus sp. EC2-1 TaxID=3388665 RepID=UPI003BEF0081
MRMAIGRVVNGRMTTMVANDKGITGYSRPLVSIATPIQQQGSIAPVPSSVELPDFMNRYMEKKAKPISAPKKNKGTFYDCLKEAMGKL